MAVTKKSSTPTGAVGRSSKSTPESVFDTTCAFLGTVLAVLEMVDETKKAYDYINKHKQVKRFKKNFIMLSKDYTPILNKSSLPEELPPLLPPRPSLI